MSARPTSPKATFDKQAIFRAHPLFGQLGAEAISRLASYSHNKSAAAGTTIFEGGCVIKYARTNVATLTNTSGLTVFSTSATNGSRAFFRAIP